MPTLFRVQVVLKHISGLPRDQVTNTFWFNANAGAVTQPEAEQVAELVRDCYVGVLVAPATTRLMNHLSPSIVTNGHEIKVSPIDEATGEDTRGLGMPPLHTEVFDLIGRVAIGTQLPAEVACCLSFKNRFEGNVPPARRRGRVYFGPLSSGSIATYDSIAQPHADLKNCLIGFGSKLEADASAAGNDWRIYSRPYEGRDEIPRPGNPRGPLPAIPARAGVSYTVSDIWVDNSFDTQRRRGERATSRMTLGVD